MFATGVDLDQLFNCACERFLFLSQQIYNWSGRGKIKNKENILTIERNEYIVIYNVWSKIENGSVEIKVM